MKTITLADVAAHAGVSKSTVSQYLNQRYEYMSANTKTKIEQSIQELGYIPNNIARSLKQKSTQTIGVIVANILHVFSTQVIRAIEDHCSERNFHVIICNADDNPEKEKHYIDMLRAKQVDGIIVFPTGGNVDLYRSLIEMEYPIVFMDRLIPDMLTDTVLLHNQRASFLAVQQLVKSGYTRIGMISQTLEQAITPRMERNEGYEKALQHFQMKVNKDHQINAKIRDMQDRLEKMMSLEERPDALIALNDRALIEVLTFVKNNRLRMPEDLAVIGIDDVSFAGIYNPAITTVAQPAFEMGKKAAEILLSRIGGIKTMAEVTRFEPTILVRDSC